MAKVTEVYMLVDGQQTRFTMKQYLALRENDTRIRSLKFIPIDSRMYEASTEQFKEWKQEQNRRAYLKASAPEYAVVSYDALMREDGTPACEFIQDETEDVAAEATERVMLETLRKALAQLSAEERQLVRAVFFEGMTEREYAVKSGIPQKTINDRKRRILAKIKNLMKSPK